MTSFDQLSIRWRIEKAMASFWWAPPEFTVIERDEVAYAIDPNGTFNTVSRVDDCHLNLKDIVQEFSEAHRLYDAKVITFPEQEPRFFQALLAEGYTLSDLHDIRYRLVQEHLPRQHSGVEVRIVRTIDDLITVEKTICSAFGRPYIANSQESLQHMQTEYHLPKPRAIRVLAVDKHTGEALGCAGMSLFDDLNVGTFFAGGVIPTARGRGVYSALIDARIHYAAQRGLDVVGLYAMQRSSSPIVHRQGFKKCGEMHYWVRTVKS